MKNDLPKLIIEIRDEHIKWGFAHSPRHIILSPTNSFLREVKERFNDSCELLALHQFFGGTEDEFYYAKSKQWDGEALLKYGSPSPIRLYMMNEERFSDHYWIYYKGKHYDVECPNGVENFFDLPYMKDQINSRFNSPIYFLP